MAPKRIRSKTASADADATELPPKRRQLGRRNSEEKVERSVNLHFPHVDKSYIETHRVNNLLVRERVAKDMKAAKDGRLGNNYWV